MTRFAPVVFAIATILVGMDIDGLEAMYRSRCGLRPNTL